MTTQRCPLSYIRKGLLTILLATPATALRLPLHSVPAAALSRPNHARHVTAHLCAEEASDEGAWWEDYWWEDGLTCVEYDQGGEQLLGVYIKYSMVIDEPHIRPLCSADEEDGVSALLQDEDAPTAPLSAVTRVLDPDYVFVSERQAGGGQGLGNP